MKLAVSLAALLAPAFALAQCKTVCMPDEERDAKGCCASATKAKPSQRHATNAAGPTLQETLTWIAEKMSAVGTVTMSPGNTRAWRPIRMTGCRIAWAEVITDSGGPMDQEYELELGQLNPESLAVSKYFDVDLWTITGRLSSNPPKRSWLTRRVGWPEWNDNSFPHGNLSQYLAYTPDEELAKRLQKALVHAIELCGRGSSKPEPF